MSNSPHQDARAPWGTEQVLARLERLERAGVRWLGRGRWSPGATSAPPPAETKPTPVERTVEQLRSGESSGPVEQEVTIEEQLPMTPPVQTKQAGEPARATSQQGAADGVAGLEVIRREVAACTRCSKLASTRTQTVFGVGNPKARLVFCGEAPGADEDAQGEPFVGRAGQLLTKIIEACTLRREDVYILNVLKCRPPENRNPLPDEVANCRGYLDRQLEVIRPEFICCLGSVAAKTLLETEESIGRLRHRWHDYRGVRVWCTYHPAYLLRNPAAKKDVWEDMKILMRELGIVLEKK
ncbi:MAG: uracil-DNA glycosylase [Pirellulales bacterium]|nr:uracil-DNA glycosylase [Pirellulales bacterium]